MNFKSFLLEQINQTFDSIYRSYIDQFIDIFGMSSNRYPTPRWVAGQFKKINLMNTLDDEILNSEISDDVKLDKEILINFRNFFIKNKLLTRTNGKVDKVGDITSKFTQYLTSKPDTELDKIIRQLSYDIDSEWADTLSDDEKKMLDLYKNINVEDYRYLLGLLAKQKSKKNYSNIIDSSDINNPERIYNLENLNLIKDNKLNLNLIKTFISFIEKYGYTRLKDFNPDFRYAARHLSANTALAKNHLIKMLSSDNNFSNSFIPKAEKILELNNTSVTKLINKQKLTTIDVAALEKLGIIQNNKITDLGNIVIARAKLNKTRDEINSDLNDLKMARIKDYDNSDLRSGSREDMIKSIASSPKFKRDNDKVIGQKSKMRDLSS